MARAFLTLGESGVRYSRSDTGVGSVQMHYTRSVLSIHGTRGVSGFLAGHAVRELARGLQGPAISPLPLSFKDQGQIGQEQQEVNGTLHKIGAIAGKRQRAHR